MPEGDRKTLEALATRGVEALGLRNGAAHCEIRCGEQGAVLLEIGARLVGGGCARVFDHALDRDIHQCLLRLALGEEQTLPRQQPDKACGAMMMPIPETAGRLVAIHGTERVRSLPGIRDVVVTVGPGDVFIPFPEQNCYKGYMIANCETFATVEETLGRAAELIEFELEPLECETWERSITSLSSYRPPAEHRIRSLVGLELEAAEETALALIAGFCFGEYPADLGRQKARDCWRRLESGCEGATSPSLWIAAPDQGVAVGTLTETTGHLCMLGMLHPHRHPELGEALVCSLLAALAQQGCDRVEVEVEPRHSWRATLLRRLGFQPRACDDACCCPC